MKAVITSRCHPSLLNRLEKSGYEIIFQPGISYDELLLWMRDAQGLVISTGVRVDRNLLNQSPALQWIGRLGSGLEHVDLEAAEARGIQVFSSPEGNCDAVGEHALALLLNLMNRIQVSSTEVKAGKWLREENRGRELGTLTVGIIGYGNTGSAFAKKLAGFGVQILAYDKYRRSFGSGNVKEVSLQALLQHSDVVSMHVPLNAETMHMADKAFFAQMKKQPWFLNTSRGKVHDTTDLLDALANQQIAGAGLDVLENERLETYTEIETKQLNALLSLPNVLITPHIAGYSHEAFFKMSKVLADKIGLAEAD
ncbi:MAG: hydroxyacid dehydrogenase [Bacteroidetes bacterium]|nr:hydroxyacid dehydrogenase [Bacteroidota bacterium]